MSSLAQATPPERRTPGGHAPGGSSEPEPQLGVEGAESMLEAEDDEVVSAQELIAYLRDEVGLKEKPTKPFFRTYARGLVEAGCDSVDELQSLSAEELQKYYGFLKFHAAKVLKHAQNTGNSPVVAESPTPHSERWTVKRLLARTHARDTAL